MGPTAIARMHQPAISRQLVDAHPKRRPDRLRSRHKERTAAAMQGRLLGKNTGRPEIPATPPLLGIRQPRPTQPRALRGIPARTIRGRRLGRNIREPRVMRLRRQHVTGMKIPGANPLRPRHPIRGLQGLPRGGRHERRLVDRDVLASRRARHHHLPLPPRVARDLGGEAVRRHMVGVIATALRPHVCPHLLGAFAHLPQCLARHIDRLGT